MKAPQLSPGDWRVETVRTQIGVCHKIGPFEPRNDMERNACIYDDGADLAHPTPTLIANAHLMAASKQLAEALNALGSKFKDDPGTSDLYDEQPLTLSITLGEWRKARMALLAAGYTEEA